MYFKRLEMQGFKSFVEPVVIDFNAGVTCVVGPNGSGKSNLSDAIRWVLGEQSAKSIRAGKMEDIIFSGTATRKPRGMAEVTLVIDNEEGVLPIEYSEVSITRRLYRSGESEYLINNNPCRLKDIKELIMDTGIGVDGYSIISQGKITDLVESKPEARREVFEEAAGVVLYKSKKQEAERKLSSTQNNLDRVNDIVAEIEGRIGNLKEDSEKAKEYLTLRDRRKELEINITLRNVEKFSESNEAGERDVRELTNRIENAKFEKTQIDISVDEKRDRSDALDRLEKDARDNLIAKVEEINEITSKTQVDNEKLSSIENDIKRIESEIEDLNNKLSAELEISNEKEVEREALSKKVVNAQDELKEAIDEYNKKSNINLEISEALENSKKEMVELSNLAVEKRADAKSYEQYKENLKAQKERLINDAKDMEANSSDLLLALSNAEKELDEKEKEISDNKSKQNEVLNKLNEITFSIKDINLSLEDAKLNISRIQSRKKTIEEMESNYEGYNSAVKFLMKQNISGIHGVVAELIKAPLGYEIAIETALGATMQNVVCEKDADAKRAINVLKDNSAGRLTFLPIESVSGSNIKVNTLIEKSRGYIGVASDLVEYDIKFDGIIKYLLGRTVIVSDMDTAISLSKIEKNNLRFVTIDGEVISATGAITGGKYKNQSANLLSRRNEIKKLDSEILELDNKVSNFKSQISTLEEDKVKKQNELNSLFEEEKNLQIVSANLKAKINSINENSKDTIEAKNKRERDLNNIENDFNNADKMIEEALRDANAYELSVKGMEAEITIKGIEFETSKNEIREANEVVTNKRIALNSIEKECEKLDSLLQINLDNIDELTEEIDIKEEKLEETRKKKVSMVYGNTDSEETVKKLENERQELEAYINEIDEEKASLSEELKELTKKQSNISLTINDMIAQKEDYNIKLARNEAQLEMQKNKLMEEFEISYAQALSFKKEEFAYSSAVKEAREIKFRMDELGDVNVGAISEYEQVSERYKFLSEQKEDILKAKEELVQIINNIDKTIRIRFKDNFDKVALNFESTFKELFGGGEAELTLVDETNPLESGIDINVQPPGKKIQNIDAFSGGEKTMIGLALMMAVLKTKPTPFCILDEVEAALDDANIDKFAGSLRGFNKTQFAVITHQKATMEHADVLYGVTMPERGISKVLSLRLGDNFDLGDN